VVLPIYRGQIDETYAYVGFNRGGVNSQRQSCLRWWQNDRDSCEIRGTTV